MITLVDDIEPDGFRYQITRSASRLTVKVTNPSGKYLIEKVTSTSKYTQLDDVEIKLTEEIAARLARKLGWKPT